MPAKSQSQVKVKNYFLSFSETFLPNWRLSDRQGLSLDENLRSRQSFSNDRVADDRCYWFAIMIPQLLHCRRFQILQK